METYKAVKWIDYLQTFFCGDLQSCEMNRLSSDLICGGIHGSLHDFIVEVNILFLSVEKYKVYWQKNIGTQLKVKY